MTSLATRGDAARERPCRLGALARGLLAGLVVVFAGCTAAPRIERGPASHAIPIGDSAFLDREVQRDLSDQPGVSGVRLVRQNPLAFVYRLETARKAERSLDVQYYIWHHDFTGKLLASELVQAADRGVRVRMLLDDLDVDDRRELLAAADLHPNLEVRVFNPFYGGSGAIDRLGELLQRGFRLNHRMHNKAWIADNRVAIIGGRNIGDEYFGASEHANFSDTGLVLGGPVVAQVSSEFDEYWNSSVAVPVAALLHEKPRPEDLVRLRASATRYRKEAGQAPFSVALRDPARSAEWLARRPPALKVSEIRVVADDPEKMDAPTDGNASRVLDAVSEIMAGAKREILIISPYFVPGDSGVEGLAVAARQGVRVAVLTNSLAATDVVAVHAGYAGYRKELLRSGVSLYEMKRTAGDAAVRRRISWAGSSQASLHTKAVIVDDRWVFIGSMNLDPRSVDINTEMGVVVESPELAAQLHAQFDQNTAPDMSYAVSLGATGGLVWRDRVDGREREQTTEPDAGTGRRFVASFLRLLPLESQL